MDKRSFYDPIDVRGYQQELDERKELLEVISKEREDIKKMVDLNS